MKSKPDDVLIYKYTQQLQATSAKCEGEARKQMCTDILINLLFELGYDAVIEVYDEIIT